MARMVVILGATASGKSTLAVELAEGLAGGAEIISADSMQVYRGMDAGTAKPAPALRGRVVHHGIDVVDPTEPFTVAQWLALVEPVIDRLLDCDITPIVVGGTHLYLQALLVGMFEGPGGDAVIRRALEQVEQAELRRRLEAMDPAAAQRIHSNDRRRTIRALEVHQLTGKPLSAWQQQWEQVERDAAVRGSAAYRRQPILIGLHWPTEQLNRRINARVRGMFNPDPSQWPTEGLVEETRRLDEAGLLGPQAREALGYKQVLEHLAGRGSLTDTVEQVKIQTRRYGKQQRTWLRRFRGVRWLDAIGGELGEKSTHIVNSHS